MKLTVTLREGVLQVLFIGKALPVKNTEMGKNGSCQVNRLGDFLSGRSAVITQVSIRGSFK